MGGPWSPGPNDEAAPPSRAPRTPSLHHALLVRTGEWTTALPITEVIETMRALPVRPVAGAPAFVRGVSIIRGQLMPVVDLGALLGAKEAAEDAGKAGRFVTVRAGSKPFALRVDQVLGAKFIEDAALTSTPALLSEALPEHASKLAALDGQMVVVLRTARVLPEELRARLLGEDQG